MKTYLIVLLGVLLLCGCSSPTPKEDIQVPRIPKMLDGNLGHQLDSIIQPYKAKVGIAVSNLEGHVITLNNDHHYPMQSVFKFPLGMTVLDQVDKGKISLAQKVAISKSDLRTQTWSPLRDSFPEGGVELTVEELLKYTVSQSDNNGCDILFKLVGGTKVVENYLHTLGIKDIAIAADEKEMAQAWDVQYTNWTTPEAMLNLLEILYEGKHLSNSSNTFLMRIMEETTTGPLRLKGLLPPETIVAHKTGTGNTNDAGMTSATNDVGIVTLPNGKHFAIVVFVTDTYESHETNEKIIAEVARAVYLSFLNDSK